MRWPPRARAVALAAALLPAASAPVRAELVVFPSGRTLSVKAHRVEGDSLVLTLRTGGEIVCDRALVSRIEPDEVPYPEPMLPGAAESGESAAASLAVPFGDLIDRVAAAHRVPARLARAVVQVESGFQQRARSRKGAMGLMQLMPGTARQYAVADPYEPRSNLEAGIRYLRELLDRFDLPLALAAYNAGEAAVRRFGGIPPYPETRHYVERVMELLR